MAEQPLSRQELARAFAVLERGPAFRETHFFCGTCGQVPASSLCPHLVKQLGLREADEQNS